MAFDPVWQGDYIKYRNWAKGLILQCDQRHACIKYVSSSLQCRDTLPDAFKRIGQSVKQGDILSYVMFSLFLNVILPEFHESET